MGLETLAQSCGATLQGLQLQQRGGRAYTLQRLIGKGAHGQVWLGTDEARSEYALKVMCPSTHEGLRDSDVGLLAKEISRARAASDCLGDLVPRFCESFSMELRLGAEDVELLVIVMEYIDGIGVDKLVMHRPCQEIVASIILRSLCIALSKLHELGTIHRDVKCANLLVSRSGRICLCDFGVSKQLEKAQDRTSTMVGTPFWMAPEVVSARAPGEEPEHGCEADVWSLGVTAMELVEGIPPLARDPFCGANPYHVFHVVRRASAPRLGPEYSMELRSCVARCLVKNVSRRAQLAELLAHPFLQEVPGGAEILKDALNQMEFETAEASSRNHEAEVYSEQAPLEHSEPLSTSPLEVRNLGPRLHYTTLSLGQMKEMFSLSEENSSKK